MSKKAFTLIELLVVVAVLALLASIVFSNLGGAREGARISNALSFQSQTHSLLGSDLMGWWNFNEGSGTTARDISGYDNHGIIIGATYADGVLGTGGTALEFDGVGDYVDIEEIWYGDNWTLSFWFKANTIENYNSLFADDNEGSARGGIAFFNNQLWVREKDEDGKATFRTNTFFNVDAWYYAVAIRDSGVYKWHINGVEDKISGQDEYANIDKIDRIGNSNSTSGINGLIDDVRIYSRALTASEIQTLYAQTKDNYLAND